MCKKNRRPLYVFKERPDEELKIKTTCADKRFGETRMASLN